MNDAQVADLLSFLRKIAKSLERIADNLEMQQPKEGKPWQDTK
jgi:hypothetical protein